MAGPALTSQAQHGSVRGALISLSVMKAGADGSMMLRCNYDRQQGQLRLCRFSFFYSPTLLALERGTDFHVAGPPPFWQLASLIPDNFQEQDHAPHLLCPVWPLVLGSSHTQDPSTQVGPSSFYQGSG